MKLFKKVLAVLCVFTLLFTLSSCGMFYKEVTFEEFKTQVNANVKEANFNKAVVSYKSNSKEDGKETKEDRTYNFEYKKELLVYTWSSTDSNLSVAEQGTAAMIAFELDINLKTMIATADEEDINDYKYYVKNGGYKLVYTEKNETSGSKTTTERTVEFNEYGLIVSVDAKSTQTEGEEKTVSTATMTIKYSNTEEAKTTTTTTTSAK